MNGRDKELVSEILAGKMKNAWQVEDRPNQPDTRPARLRQGGWNTRGEKFRNNYDSVFRGKGNSCGSQEEESQELCS